MKQEILARTIIETMINKSLRDIERDPDRSIRNLIDLGINFAKGRFQREFLRDLQQMMQNEQSAYYTLVKNAVSWTDHRRLKTIGINIGFQACTVGANQIRENEERYQFNIPWIYQVFFGSEGLPCQDLDKLIRQGKELGTFAYLLNGRGSVLEEHIGILKRHADCAFVLRAGAEEILGDLLDLLKSTYNCLVLVEDDSERMMEAADELKKNGLLYGVCAEYPADGDLLAPLYLEKISASGASFFVLMNRNPFSFAEDMDLKEKADCIRRQQEYPFIPVCFNSDVQRIDQVVSNDSCAVAFDADGFVYTDTGKWQDTPYNIRYKDLRDILEKVTKKEDGVSAASSCSRT